MRLKSVILSPQQHSILNKNEPFVFLRGEPGTGKTLLLLAKALLDALNPANNVIYVIPKQNSKLTELLQQFCGRMGLSSLSNFQIVELKEFNQHFFTDTTENYCVLFDELYLDSDYKMLCQLKKRVKSLWIANVLLVTENLFLPKVFTEEILYVSFRNAKLISEAATSAINNFRHRPLAETAVRVIDCFQSNLDSFPVKYVHSSEEAKTHAKYFLTDHENTKNLVIVFDSTDKGHRFQGIGESIDICYVLCDDKKLTPEKKSISFVRHFDKQRFDFAGSEYSHVLIIIMCIDFDRYLDDLILALTRAQYEVHFIVSHEFGPNGQDLNHVISPSFSAQKFARNEFVAILNSHELQQSSAIFKINYNNFVADIIKGLTKRQNSPLHKTDGSSRIERIDPDNFWTVNDWSVKDANLNRNVDHICALLEDLGLSSRNLCSKLILRVKNNSFGDFLYKSEDSLFIFIDSLDRMPQSQIFHESCADVSNFTVSLESIALPIMFRIFSLVFTVYFECEEKTQEPSVQFVLNVMKRFKCVVFTDYDLRDFTYVTSIGIGNDQKFDNGVLNYVTVIKKSTKRNAFKPMLPVGCGERYLEMPLKIVLFGKNQSPIDKKEQFFFDLVANNFIEEVCQKK